MKPLYRLNIIPSLPEQLTPLWELGHNLWWTLEQGNHPHPLPDRPGNVGRESARSPALLDSPAARPARRPNRRQATAGPHRARRRAIRGLFVPADVVWPDARREPNAGCVLLGGVRPDREPAYLFRGLGRALRRPPQGRQRSRHSPRRGWLALPRGLFPPSPQRRWLANRAQPGKRLLPDARAAGPRWRRRAPDY